MTFFAQPAPAAALVFALCAARLVAEEAHVQVHDHGAHVHSQHRAKSDAAAPIDVLEFMATAAAAEAFQREEGSCLLEDSRPKTLPTVKAEPYEIPESFLVRMQYKRTASQEAINSKFETLANDALSTPGLQEIAKKMTKEFKDSPLAAMTIVPRTGSSILKFFGGQTTVGFDFKEADQNVASMTTAPLRFMDDNKCLTKFRCPPQQHCKCLVTNIVMAVTTDTFNAAVQNVLVEQWLEALSIFAFMGFKEDFQLAEWVRVEPKEASELKKGAMPMPWGPVFWMPPKADGQLGTLRNCAPNAVLEALGIKASQTVPRTSLVEVEQVEGEAEGLVGGEAFDDSKEIHSERSGSRSVRANGEIKGVGHNDGATPTSSSRLVRTAF